MTRRDRYTELTRENMFRSEEGTPRPPLKLEGLLSKPSLFGPTSSVAPRVAWPPLAPEGVLWKSLLRCVAPSVAILSLSLGTPLSIEGTLSKLLLRAIVPRPLRALEGVRVGKDCSEQAQKSETLAG